MKAINDTLGPERIVTSALVFRELPSILASIRPEVPRATLAERIIAAQESRKPISKHLSPVKFRFADRCRTPMATEHMYQPGDQALLWMKK